MEKIDRLGWAAGIAFVSYGLRIGVRANEPKVLDRAIEHLPPGWKPASSPEVDFLYSIRAGGPGGRLGVRKYNLLYAGEATLARSMNLDELFGIFDSHLHLYVADRARRRLFVHAGVVGWQGHAIVLPGSSASGKTTLVEALVRKGATYYSDEYAVFDKRGRVHAYPKPPVVKKGNGRTKKRLSLEALDRGGSDKPLPVGCIVVAQYRSQKNWRPRRLSQGRAVLELLAHAVPARRRPKGSLTTLGQVVSDARAFKGVRGEAEGVVEWILENCPS